MSLDAIQDAEGSSVQQARTTTHVDNPVSIPPTATNHFDLADRLEGVVASFESQAVRLGEACLQINQIVDEEDNLSNLQCMQLKDRFFTSIEQVSAHRSSAISRGHRDEAGPERDPDQPSN